MDIQEIVAGIGASDALQNGAGKLGISTDQAQSTLQSVLEHVSSGQSLEGMAESIAGRVGLDPSQVQQFLPNVMGLLQGHADNAEEGVQNALGGLMSSLQGSPIGGLLSGLDGNGDGSIADEAVGLVKGLFDRK
jgi:hypothetical protein